MTAPISPGSAVRIRFRRAWIEDWTVLNPVLPDGVPGYDKTNNMLKVGDGVTPWNDLAYLSPPPTEAIVITGDAAIDAVMTSHVNSSTPHPVYDDGPSFLLLYHNAKV